MQWQRFDEFSPAELYEMLAFRQAVFVVEQRSPYPDLDGRDQAALHLLSRQEGAIAGYLRLIAEANRVRIGRVAVAAPLRGQGLGRLLMAAALEKCRADFPLLPVALSAQSYLVPFYAGFGFAVMGAPYDDYGVPHVDMLKEEG
jgi:ElaA protein